MKEGRGYSFALSAAISRFLNLITHAGMNMCNSSKFYDVAKFFKIPGRIVDARHDINHGQMPSKAQLEEIVQYCFKWILLNYWEFEDTEQMNLTTQYKMYENYEFIHDLLDSYKNLKIFSLWGHKSLKEVQDQEEIFESIAKVLDYLNDQAGPPNKKRKKNQNGGKPNKDDNISDNLVKLRNQISKLLNPKNVTDCHIVLLTLCKDQLLIPHKDMLESLKESSDTFSLPTNLMMVWSDVLAMIHKIGMLPVLCRILKEQDSLLAMSWLEVIFTSLQSKKQKNKFPLRLQQDENECDGRWNEIIEEFLLSGDSYVLTKFFDGLTSLRNPPLSKSQCDRIKILANLRNGCDVIEDVDIEDWVPKEVNDVYVSKQKSNENDSKKWVLCNQQDWSSIPLGACPGDQTLKTLVVSTDVGSPKSNHILIENEFNVEEVKKVDWHTLLTKFSK